MAQLKFATLATVGTV